MKFQRRAHPQAGQKIEASEFSGLFPQPGDAPLARMSFLIVSALFSRPFSLTPSPV